MADTLTTRSDISRAMYIGTKEVFMKNLKKQPEQDWKAAATLKKSENMEETYDSVGNLKPAHVKDEGNAVVYGDIKQAYRTTVKNETVANGFSVTMEAQEDEKWGLVPETKVNELIRTMISKKEQAVAAIWDEVTTEESADGKAYAAVDHPLKNTANAVNNNLIDKAFNLASYQEGVNRFNHWYNHFGDKFYTKADAILAHRDRQTQIFAMLQSSLVPFEQSNTKNTIPQLKAIFNSYISGLQTHILDTTIDSAILQERKGMTSGYDYDKRSTFNWYFNVHERYKAAMINPGFGFVTITGRVGDNVLPPIKYTVSATTPATGADSGAVSGGTFTGLADYAEGETVTIKAPNPASGKKFKKWVTADIGIDDPTEQEITFIMPNRNVTLVATYAIDE